MYVLVMLSPDGRQKETAEMTQRHVKFVTELIRGNKILLAGVLEGLSESGARSVPIEGSVTARGTFVGI